MEEQVDMRLLGERVLLLRRRAGLTQQALATQAGIDVMTISRVERGTKKRLQVEPLARLAKALATTTDYLLGMDADQDATPAPSPTTTNSTPTPSRRRRTTPRPGTV